MTYNESNKTHHGIDSRKIPKDNACMQIMKNTAIFPAASPDYIFGKLSNKCDSLFQQPLQYPNLQTCGMYAQPVGKNKLAGMMARISSAAGLSKRHTKPPSKQPPEFMLITFEITTEERDQCDLKFTLSSAIEAKIIPPFTVCELKNFEAIDDRIVPGSFCPAMAPNKPLSCSRTLDHLNSKLGFGGIADIIDDKGDCVWSNSEVEGQAWIIVLAGKVS
ncbi:unnamed protein product [Mytilus coruscus]|uniref:Uncharacterized protein n=1 Tax=Mytilus coruscus TaxID=42192 RepID=A0A6J8AM98_MYTCO|nr:unnamed protein product [Mytilus coruscus]